MEYQKGMDIKFPALGAGDIDVKIKQVGKGGSVALLYKDARVDMKLLDQIVGSTNWKSTYQEIKGNLYCTVSIYDHEKKEWVGKEDCGIESREDDGNEKKGESSDAFKRACFKWGLGRELYTAPFIFITSSKLPVKSLDNGRFELEDKFSRLSVKSIDYDKDKNIKSLVIVDSKGNEVYSFGNHSYKKTEVEIKPLDETNNLSVAKMKSIIMDYYAGLVETRKTDFNNWLKGTYKTSVLSDLNDKDLFSVLKTLKLVPMSD